MQEQQPRRQFGKETAKFIAELVNNQSGGYEFLEFRDDGQPPGVYVSETYIGLFPSGVEGIEAGNVFEWNPACDTEDDTDPEATPLLPVPFTAKELAAFLLYGVGDYIQERLGRIGQLDEDQLSKLGGVRKKLPRQALRAAYAEAERAQQIVGLPDIETQELAYSLSEQLDEAEREENHRQGVFARDISPEEASRRRALVVESLAELRKRTQVAKSEAAAKTAQWRSAMVRQLLEPLPQTPEQPVRAVADREELARLRAEVEAREAEQARIKAEQEAEAARIAAEREELAKLRAEAETRRKEEERKAAEGRAAEEAQLESPGPRELQRRHILQTALRLSFDPHAIPTGGKKTIKDICLAERKDLFTEAGFDHAWKDAIKGDNPTVRMKDHNTYSRRR